MVYGRVLNNIKNHVSESTNYLKPSPQYKVIGDGIPHIIQSPK